MYKTLFCRESPIINNFSEDTRCYSVTQRSNYLITAKSLILRKVAANEEIHYSMCKNSKHSVFL